MRTIAIIGSTGSIGTQTLDVVRANADIRIGALAAGNNIELLEKQVREFKPALVSVQSKDKADALRIALSDFNCKIVYGMDGLIAVATYEPAELVVTAIVGMIGIRPTIEAIKAGKDIALANKETLVTAGHLIMKLAEEYHVRILPVDSEHSAIFQCLHGERENKIAKLLITASGGPFLGNTREELKDVTVEDALKHPNWSMGRKITIDSATLVNKGLEVIEARWLFDVMPEDIEVVVQPQSIIHSMVEFEDGAIKAQLGTADMRLPIQYALYYPERRYLAGDRLDFSKIAGIITSKPDRETFKGLDFAYQAIKTGGSMPTVLNAANECAVAKFLHKDIKFLQIYDIIEGWHLILANRYMGCAECCDIGCLTDWVAEETNRDACLEVTHLNLSLYSRVTLYTRNGNKVHIIECKLRQFRDHGLDEDRCLLRVKSTCEVIKCNLHDVLTYLLRVLCIICECLCVRDHDIDLIIDTRILKFHTLFQRAYIMSNMQTSCRTIAS